METLADLYLKGRNTSVSGMEFRRKLPGSREERGSLAESLVPRWASTNGASPNDYFTPTLLGLVVGAPFADKVITSVLAFLRTRYEGERDLLRYSWADLAKYLAEHLGVPDDELHERKRNTYVQVIAIANLGEGYHTHSWAFPDDIADLAEIREASQLIELREMQKQQRLREAEERLPRFEPACRVLRVMHELHERHLGTAWFIGAGADEFHETELTVDGQRKAIARLEEKDLVTRKGTTDFTVSALGVEICEDPDRLAHFLSTGSTGGPRGSQKIEPVRGTPSDTRRYQVFISSTFKDLHEQRQALTLALLDRYIPAGMEQFPATNDRGWEIIRQTIELSDYYVVLVAGRYGSVDPGTGFSWTEREYTHAVQAGLRPIPFIRDKSTITQDQMEDEGSLRERLEQFRTKLQNEHHVKPWLHEQDLITKVKDALDHQIRADENSGSPRPGWCRGAFSKEVSSLGQITEEGASHPVGLSDEANKYLTELARLYKEASYPNHRVWRFAAGQRFPEHDELMNGFHYIRRLGASGAPYVLTDGGHAAVMAIIGGKKG